MLGQILFRFIFSNFSIKYKLSWLHVKVEHHFLNQNCVVAQALWISFTLEAEALIGTETSIIILVGAPPVWAALVTAVSSPPRLADAKFVSIWKTRSIAESIVAIQVT